MLVVAFGTAALVIVLSVFNGLEGLIRDLYNTFDPEIKITTLKGKAFPTDSAFISKVQSTEGVAIVTEVVEENALVELRDDRRVVKVKGVSENFIQQSRMDSAIVAGDFLLHKGGKPFAIIGRGIQYTLNISLNNEFYPLKISYPNNKKILNPTAHNLLVSKFIPVGAIFAIEKQYDDNYIFTPIDFARKLFDMQGESTDLEIKTKPGFTISRVKKNLQKTLGKDFLVLDSDEQHASLLRAIKIEKLFVYIIFSFLLLIASVNIFFSLTMLSLEKKKDIAILLSMGASRGIIRKIFLMEGLIIALVGACTGLIIGLGVCLAQQQYGFVSMGMETAVVDAYPVRVKPADFILTGIIIVLLTLAISYRPSNQASTISIRENI